MYLFMSFFNIWLIFLLHRYLVDDNRAIFLFKDGSQAWTAKEYLIEQEHCESVTIESKVYQGKHHPHMGTVERTEL